MKRIFTLLLCLLTALTAMAQNATREKIEFNLWPNGAPTSNGVTAAEESNQFFVVNVTQPVLTVYLPQEPNGLAVLACPGGSYIQVWQGTEGHNMAEWYNAQGIVYAVLNTVCPILTPKCLSTTCMRPCVS